MAFNLDALATKLGGIVGNIGDYADRALDIYGAVKEGERKVRHAVDSNRGRPTRGELPTSMQAPREAPIQSSTWPSWALPVAAVAVLGAVYLSTRRR